MSNYSRNRGQKVVKSGDYATMIAGLDRLKAAGYTNVVGELHTGGLVTSTSLIGRYVWDATAGVYQPDGEVRLDRVTDSRVAVIGAGVTGSELHTDSNAAVPQDGATEIDGVGAWITGGTTTGGTVGSEAGGAPGAGSFHLFCKAGTVNSAWSHRLFFTLENSTEYLVSFWCKVATPAAQQVSVSNSTGFVLFPRNTEWQHYQGRITTTGTSVSILFYSTISGTDPNEKIMFDAVSILKIDDASTKIACNPDHNITSTNDTLTIWDVSAGDTDDTGVTIASIDGRFINLDSALAQTPEAGIDYAHAEGTCEFGELLAAGLWQPAAQTRVWWASGLHGIQTGLSGALMRLRLLFLGNGGAVTDPFLTEVHAHMATTDYTSGNFASFFVGFYSAGQHSVGGIYNNLGTWKSGIQYNALGSPSLTVGAAIGDGTVPDLEISHSIVPDTATNCHVSTQAKGTGVTEVAALGAVYTALSQAQAANGPYLGVLVACRCFTSGMILWDLSKIRVEWMA